MEAPVPASGPGQPGLPTAPPPGPAPVPAHLLKYREVLVAADQKGQEEFDKAVLSLSGGGLAVSLVFIKDVIGARPIAWTELLMGAWGAWGLSTLLVLLSYHFSNLTIREGIAQIDRGEAYKGPFGGWFASATQWFNAIGAFLFFAGVLLITAFACVNLPTETANANKPAGAASGASASASAVRTR